MAILASNTNRIAVQLPFSMTSDTDWSKYEFGTFVGNYNGINIYVGNFSIGPYYIESRDLEAVIFEDTYAGTVLLEALGLDVDLRNGLVAGVLSYASKYGLVHVSPKVTDVVQALEDSIKYGIIDTASLSAEGIIYNVKGYDVLSSGFRLFVKVGNDYRELN